MPVVEVDFGRGPWKVRFPYKNLAAFQKPHQPEQNRIIRTHCHCGRIMEDPLHVGSTWDPKDPDDLQHALRKG